MGQICVMQHCIKNNDDDDEEEKEDYNLMESTKIEIF